MVIGPVQQARSGMKINVGCGVTPTPGWLNFDNSLSVRLARFPRVASVLTRLRLADSSSTDLVALAQSGAVRFANAAVRIPCANNSVAAVYSSHMIEHLDRDEARAFLKEVWRVLEPGGTVRLAAPDLSRLVQIYVAGGDADSFVSGTHMGLQRPIGLRSWLKWVLIGPRHHLWMYDGKSLSHLLHEAGFAEVAVMSPGSTRIPEPGELDLRERAAESVYAEAVKLS